MTALFPRNLVALAKIATKPAETSRYPTNCLRVLDPGDSTYRVEVTDGRMLAVVRGESPEQPPFAGLAGAAQERTEGLVSAADWTQAFRLPATKDRNQPDEIGLVLSGGQMLFGTAGQTLAVAYQEGRFPPINSVLPQHRPLATVRFSPLMLAKLLEVAAAFTTEDDKSVTLLFWGKDKPVGVIGHNARGQFFDGLVMPLVS